MGGLSDRFVQAVRAALRLPLDERPPHIDRLAHYRAEVKAASSDGKTVDVTPLDTRISPHQAVPLRRTPGEVVVVQPGAIVMLGWDGGDPKAPHCLALADDGATVTKRVLNGSAVYVGEESGAQPITLADNLETYFGSSLAVGSLLKWIYDAITSAAGGVPPGLNVPPTMPANVKAQKGRAK